MTRINVIPVQELCNQHLFAEWREMPRLIGNLKNSLNRKQKPFHMSEIPEEYVLGSGHVKFFFNKFKYLHKRHKEITSELLKRGYNLNVIDSGIFREVDEIWYGDYSPTEKAIEINRERIKQKMPRNPKWSKI